MQKTVLITGCSSGFGLDLTKTMLQQNWRVIATARHPEQSVELQQLKHPALVLLPLDVTQPKAIEAVAHYISETLQGRLDCLINNAGFGLVGAFEELSEQQIREQLEVNLFGVLLLTQKLLPYLREQRGRIIMLSSVLGYLGLPMQSLYVTSKFALEGFSESLYYELYPHQVQITLVEPGVHATAFGKNMKTATKNRELPVYEAQRTGYQTSRETISKRLSAPSMKVTRCILRLLKKPTMPLRVRVGFDAKLVYFLKWLLPARLFIGLLRVVYAPKSE